MAGRSVTATFPYSPHFWSVHAETDGMLHAAQSFTSMGRHTKCSQFCTPSVWTGPTDTPVPSLTLPQLVTAAAVAHPPARQGSRVTHRQRLGMSRLTQAPPACPPAWTQLTALSPLTQTQRARPPDWTQLTSPRREAACSCSRGSTCCRQPSLHGAVSWLAASDGYCTQSHYCQ